MRLARTLAALLFFSSLCFSCTVDDINEDDTIITKVEDVYAHGGGAANPPDDDQGGGND